jgi:hypothetical protein
MRATAQPDASCLLRTTAGVQLSPAYRRTSIGIAPGRGEVPTGWSPKVLAFAIAWSRQRARAAPSERRGSSRSPARGGIHAHSLAASGAMQPADARRAKRERLHGPLVWVVDAARRGLDSIAVNAQYRSDARHTMCCPAALCHGALLLVRRSDPLPGSGGVEVVRRIPGEAR